MAITRIHIIGPYPEPYGGVSLHIKRLKERLEEKNINCVVYNTNAIIQKAEDIVPVRSFRQWLLKYLLSNKEDAIVHFQGSGLTWRKITKFNLMALFNKKLIITFHSLRNEINNLNWYIFLGIKILLKFDPSFIAVSSTIKHKLLDLGIKPEKIDVIPAFIPPTMKSEDITKISCDVWEFIKNHNPIICGNATFVELYQNEDLYGIDMCIHMCANLINKYPNIGVLFKISAIKNYPYFRRLQELIAQQQLENNFLMVTKSFEFYPILMKSDLFIRPTNTDGDAVSVREALYLKVPVIASDAAFRPEGTIIFKKRDLNDFMCKVQSVLSNYDNYKKRLEMIKLNDNFEKIFTVYKKLGLDISNISKQSYPDNMCGPP